MANIDIGVSSSDLLVITLDCWWSGLKVNGSDVPIDNDNETFQYSQQSSGPVFFVAIASSEQITLKNINNNLFFMKNSDATKTYFMIINYESSDDSVILKGFFTTLPFCYSQEVSSPINFNQGMMTGYFHTSP